MKGTDSTTGKPLEGIPHLQQSVKDILTTPIGSRVLRRDYGSRLFDLIDRPLNSALLIEIYAAVAEALNKWEPRLQVNKVEANRIDENGTLEILISGIYTPTGQPLTLDGIIL